MSWRAPHGDTWVGHDADAVAAEGARRFVAAAAEAIAARGVFRVALAGGSTPKAMYKRLAAPAGPHGRDVDWARVEVFFGDERSVGPEHPDSNYRTAKEALLDHVPVDVTKVHRIFGEHEPAQAAREYEATVQRAFGEAHDTPRMDLILLGMGPDGHTASLFPSTAALAETERLVVENRVDKLATWRVTFTYGLINVARAVVIATAGAEKAPMLRTLAADPDPVKYPVLGVRPTAGTLTWIVDEAAAATAS